MGIKTLKSATGTGVDGYYLESFVQEGRLLSCCDMRINANQNDYRLRHDLNSWMWSRMMDNPRLFNATGDE